MVPHMSCRWCHSPTEQAAAPALCSEISCFIYLRCLYPLNCLFYRMHRTDRQTSIGAGTVLLYVVPVSFLKKVFFSLFTKNKKENQGSFLCPSNINNRAFFTAAYRLEISSSHTANQTHTQRVSLLWKTSDER